MKKKLLSVIVAVVFVMCAGYNVYIGQNAKSLSDLALTNVEALANGEGGGFNCWWYGDWSQCIPYGNGLGCPCGSHNW